MRYCILVTSVINERNLISLIFKRTLKFLVFKILNILLFHILELNWEWSLFWFFASIWRIARGCGICGSVCESGWRTDGLIVYKTFHFLRYKRNVEAKSGRYYKRSIRLSVCHLLSQPEPQMPQTRAIRQIEAKNQNRLHSQFKYKN